MKVILIVLGVIAALWVVLIIVGKIHGRWKSKGIADDDRKAVDEWVKESGMYRSLDHRGRRTSKPKKR